MKSYEKLGAFYLGRAISPEGGEPQPILYDSKDLTTHAVCVGMTGSGKTGLCACLLEEAAIDGIPVIAIDPKGDLGNLMLTFPKLDAASFRPWVDEGEALRKGLTADQYAKKTADLWRNGLAQWDQGPQRIQRLRKAADFAIYTPGSQAGLPLKVLKSFAAPPPALLEDADAMRDRVLAATSGLLALLGIDADPLRSREHILLSNLLDRAWREGRDLSIADLIREIQSPPFKQLGVFELDSFYPANDRFALAMNLNNLLASPGFSAWMKGEPLDIGRLLWAADGRPRVSILSIAHLSDAERMFFVTLLLNEVVAWMRSQPGTTSLRALLYMDEVFGFLPPTANPPSKTPMLTLLKQARAFGLGCVLATQNPVDLDYKALSNAGTWFLGRLQTERDKARVLDGLEGASASSGVNFDRHAVETVLSGLKSRMFLMNNVHENAPALFHTRWALSYLRGPLTRAQIERLMADRKAAAAAEGGSPARRAMDPPGQPAKVAKKAAAVAAAAVAAAPIVRPSLPGDVRERFLPAETSLREGDELVYRPALLGSARLHFVSATDKLDKWDQVHVLAALDEDQDDPWSGAEAFTDALDDLLVEPEDEARFADPPRGISKVTTFKRWARLLKDHLYRTRELVIYRCKTLKAFSQPGESEGEFRGRLAHAARERRDLEVEKLRRRFTPKISRMQDRIQRAEQKVGREQSQYKQQKMQTTISLGATLLGALFGRKAASIGTVGRAATTARGVGRAARERGDIERARESLAALGPQLAELEAELEERIAEVQDKFAADTMELTEKRVRPRKSDISMVNPMLVWTPWRGGSDGVTEPLFD